MRKLTIIIPVFNEERTIAQILERVLEAALPFYEKEIIVVDNGSTDSTRKRILPFLGTIQLIVLEANQGKGGAIRRALELTSGDCVIIQDADLEYHPKDIPRLLYEFEDENIQVVYGSRNIESKRRGYLHYALGGKLLTCVMNLLFAADLTDIHTGYKLFRAELIKSMPLTSNGFEIDTELTAKVLKRGIKIKEIPIDYSPRTFEEGKKVSWRDGLISLWTMIKHRLR